MLAAAFFAKLPVSAAIPEINPPIIAVIHINVIEEPFSGKILATFCESIWSLAVSMIAACIPHRSESPTKPAKKAFDGAWGTTNATTSEVIAKLHHEKNNGAA